MKKIEKFIRNVYRVFIVKPGEKKVIVHFNQLSGTANPGLLSDDQLKRIIMSDDTCPMVDFQVQKRLEKRMDMNKTGPAFLNSVFPLFSTKNAEFKMALISLVLIITVSSGPINNHSIGRSNLLYLADTLSDTSVLHIPFIKDTAFKP